MYWPVDIILANLPFLGLKIKNIYRKIKLQLNQQIKVRVNFFPD